MSLEIWNKNLAEAHLVLETFMGNQGNIERCSQFSQILINAYENKNNVFICGNGGSHCDALHFAEELTGRYRKDRKPLGALALGEASHTTCVSNDYGFEHIFSRQIEGLGRPGDVLIGLSTSGNSLNVIKAIETAKAMGLKTVSLLGKDGGQLKNLADLSIIVPANTSDRVQEVHIKIIHIAIETVERVLFPENYA